MSGGYRVDPATLRQAAERLYGCADEVEGRGRTLTARTQTPVGHGPIGAIVESLVRRGLHAAGEGVTRTVSDFHRSTAKGLMTMAEWAEQADTEAMKRFHQIRPDPVLHDRKGRRFGVPTADRSAAEVASAPIAPPSNVAEEERAAEALSKIHELRPEIWQKLSRDKRIRILQQAENIMAELHDRPPATVKWEPAAPGIYGYHQYDIEKDSHTISIGSHSLDHDHPQEVLNTAVHEGMHAYQCHAVKNPGFHPVQAQVDAWKGNLGEFGGHYIDPAEDGWEAYRNQPVEADAWGYGDRISKETFKRLLGDSHAGMG